MDRAVFRADAINAISAEKEQPEEQPSQSPKPEDVDSSLADHYETLQISPNADFDTVTRAYRILAQRYHPDTGQTSDEAAFRMVRQAFHVLSDPEKRVAYDVQYRSHQTLRWKISDQPSSARSIKDEQQTRRGILALLYIKRLEQPNNPGVTVKDLEILLGCRREQLAFSLWYLRSKSLVATAGNGLYEITAEGVSVADLIDAA